ncbi:SDR family NAD(P)-dependent oxidoreductase, partial [Acinetobacter baumannii]
ARLADKICIITGSGSGIGRASAMLFAREGATVVVADIRAEPAETVAQSSIDAGGKARALGADVGNEADLERMIGTTVADFGQIDVLFNNA